MNEKIDLNKLFEAYDTLRKQVQDPPDSFIMKALEIDGKYCCPVCKEELLDSHICEAFLGDKKYAVILNNGDE